MKIIESKSEYIPQTDIFKHIEFCGRISYKSEDKVTENSSKIFVENLIKSNHTSVLEHGTIYMNVPVNFSSRSYNDLEKRYNNNPYSKIDFEAGVLYITTNYRVIKENHWEDDLRYRCFPIVLHEKRYTVKLITSIGIVRELLRHRKFSFTNESTRYCNYSKDKFNGELVFVKPYWEDSFQIFKENCKQAEEAYMSLIDKGYKSQEVREVLPLCTKSELCMTGFASDWRYFFDVRYYNRAGISHPDIVNLAEKTKEEFIKAEIWEDIISHSSVFDNK